VIKKAFRFDNRVGGRVQMKVTVIVRVDKLNVKRMIHMALPPASLG